MHKKSSQVAEKIWETYWPEYNRQIAIIAVKE